MDKQIEERIKYLKDSLDIKPLSKRDGAYCLAQEGELKFLESLDLSNYVNIDDLLEYDKKRNWGDLSGYVKKEDVIAKLDNLVFEHHNWQWGGVNDAIKLWLNR